MDRRSFLMMLVGGFSAVGLGGIGAADAAQPKLAVKPEVEPTEGAEAVSAELKETLDETDVEFARHYYRRRRYYRRYYRRRRYYHRHHYYRRRYYHRRRHYYCRCY